MASLGTINCNVNISGEAKDAQMNETIRAMADRMQRSVWAMEPNALMSMIHRLAVIPDMEAEPPDADIISAAPSCNMANVPRLPKVKGSVAVIPIYGAIAQHRGGDYWADAYTEDIVRMVAGAMNDDRVGAVVAAIDSPGGVVYGVAEAAGAIRGFRGQGKPLYAVGKGMVASAGYWLASAFDKIFMPASGEIGSIGVWCGHGDMSKMYEDAGIKVTLVSSGKFKTEGNPFEPLPPEAEEEMQRSVDEYHTMFKADVALGRGTSVKDVAENYGKGRLLTAEAAKKVGMIDGIATVDEVIAGIMSPAKKGSRLATAAAALGLAGIE
jgi:capsid assembly protease